MNPFEDLETLDYSSSDCAEQAASIYPFVHLTPYRLIICTGCRVACLANEAATHLRTWHHNIPPHTRTRIISAIQQIPDIIRHQVELIDFQLPHALLEPIPFLESPRKDGLGCLQCPYISRQLQKIQAHCRTQHGWINPKKRGRLASTSEIPPVPWRTGVVCQRFFRSRMASGWFEVGTPRPDLRIPVGDGSPSQNVLQIDLLSYTEDFYPLYSNTEITDPLEIQTASMAPWLLSTAEPQFINRDVWSLWPG